MKVLQHTSERLAIEERLMGVWVLSIGSIAAGLFMFFLFEPPVDWVGAFCIALGGVFATLTPSETFIFDKKIGCLTTHQTRLLKQNSTYVSMAEIQTVNLETIEMLGSRFYRINLQLVSGQTLAVTQTVSTDWQQQQKIIRHIRGFLSTTLQPEAGILQPTNPN
jgi:hypothetical protein